MRTTSSAGAQPAQPPAGGLPIVQQAPTCIDDDRFDDDADGRFDDCDDHLDDQDDQHHHDVDDQDDDDHHDVDDRDDDRDD